MSRKVCFFDDEDGQTATCSSECRGDTVICCATCEDNPFPGKVVPEDRVLRTPKKKQHRVTLIVETDNNGDSVKDLQFVYEKINHDFQINGMYAEVVSVNTEVI
jgi:hypothetical protein